MPLEDLTGNKYISDLNANWPAGTDFPDAGDDHMRGIKNVLLRSFPGITGPVTVSQDEINVLPDEVKAAQDAADACVKKAGDTMTGELVLPSLKITGSGAKISSTFDSTGRNDILFQTGDPVINTVRLGEGGGVNLKQISFRPDPAGDALGPFITTDYYTSGVYNLKIATGNGGAYPYKFFNFGQGGNAAFPGDLSVAGKITAAGGIALAMSGPEKRHVGVGEAADFPPCLFTRIEVNVDGSIDVTYTPVGITL